MFVSPNERLAERRHPASATTRRWRLAAIALWVLPMLVIGIMVFARPERRTLTPLYHEAAGHWSNRQPLYDGPAGMNYLPTFPVLFSPYHALPGALGDVFWRLTSAAGLAAGLWLFGGFLGGGDRWRTFATVSAVALPLSLPALQNGQANAHLGAALLLAAGCLRAQRWTAATVFLCLATGIKPLGLAALGLAWAAYPHLWWRLALGLPVALALPFLFGPPTYVADQYLAAWHNLRQCAAVTEHRFADLNGLLRTLGIPLTGAASTAVRALGGLLMMALSLWAGRREREPIRALLWLGLATTFLMLFNPMTEANGYVILAPALALAAWAYRQSGKPALGWAVAAMTLTMGLLPNLVRPIFGSAFALAWHPAMTLGFAGILAWQIARSPAPSPATTPPQEPSP